MANRANSPATPILVVTGITGSGKSTTLNYFLAGKAGEGEAPLPIGTSHTTAIETVIQLSPHASPENAEQYKWSVKIDASKPCAEDADETDEEKMYREALEGCQEGWSKQWAKKAPTSDAMAFDGAGLDSLATHLQHFLCNPVQAMPAFFRVVDGEPVVVKPTRVLLTVPAPTPAFEGWRIVDTVGLRGDDTKDEYTCLRVNDALANASMLNPACALLVVMKDIAREGSDKALAAATRRLIEECPIGNARRALLVVDHNVKGSLKVKKAVNAIPKEWAALASDGVFGHDQRQEMEPDTDFPKLIFDKKCDVANVHEWFAALGSVANARAVAVQQEEAAFRVHDALADLVDFVDDDQKLTDDMLEACMDAAYKKAALKVKVEFCDEIKRFRRANGRGWKAVEKALFSPRYNNIVRLGDTLDLVARFKQAIRSVLPASGIPDHLIDAVVRQLARGRGRCEDAVEQCFVDNASRVAGGTGRLDRLVGSMPSAAELADAMKRSGPSADTVRDAIAEAVEDELEAVAEDEFDAAHRSDSSTTNVIRRRTGNFAVTTIEEYSVFKRYFQAHRQMFDKEVAVAERLGAAAFPHAPRLRSCCRDRHELQYERVTGVELQKAIERCVTADARKQLFELLITAVQALHATGVAHRDLKPDNIMVCYDAATGLQPEKVMLIDFGSCSLGNEQAPHNNVYTTEANSWSDKYSAPEVTRKEPTAYKAADVYSLGRIAADMGFALTAGAGDFCAEHLDERVPGIASAENAVAGRLDELLKRFKQATLEDAPAVAAAGAPPPPPPPPPSGAAAVAHGDADREALVERLVEFIRWLIANKRFPRIYRRLITLVTMRTRRTGRENPRSLHRVLESWGVDNLRLLVAVAAACQTNDAAVLTVARGNLIAALPSAPTAVAGMIYLIVSTAPDGASALAYVGHTTRTFAQRYSNNEKRDLATQLPERVRQQWANGTQRAVVLLRTSPRMPSGASEFAFMCLLGTLFEHDWSGVNWNVGGLTDENMN